MFLVISQVIILLASGGSINQLPESVSVYEQEITLGDLNEIKAKYTASKASVAPVTLDDLKAVEIDLNKVRKNLREINLNFDPMDEHIDVEKVESKPVVAPPVPVVVKKDKENIESRQKITENKKVVLIKKAPVVIALPVSSDDKKNQLTDKTNDEGIIVTEIKLAYIKHDSKGNSVEDNNEQWTCVFDTKTGLMWEVKSEEDAMRNSENLYSWYDPDNKVLKGVTDGGRCKGGTGCDTNAYVNAMNKRNYCGHNDWHLPSREEMQTLVDLKNTNEEVKINKRYFPQTVPSWYWTSSDEDNKDEFAWYVLFRNGVALSDLKERPKHIRLVRSNI